MLSCRAYLALNYTHSSQQKSRRQNIGRIFTLLFYQSRYIAKLIYFHTINFLLLLRYSIFFIRIFIYVFSQHLVNAPGTSAISNFTHETSCGTIKATTKAMIASDVANANKRQNARRDLHMNFLFECGKKCRS